MKCDSCKLKAKCDDLERAGILPKIEDCRAFVPLPTNADRIRAMSDEELAVYLVCDIEAEAIRRAGRYLTSGEINRAVADCLDWLKQEAAEPPKANPAPICQTCGNFETCPWRHEGIFSGPKDKARRVVACSDYKDTT